MAIGDAFSAILGTATTNRQPASGVEEQLASISKNAVTDDLAIYDGSTTIAIIGHFTTGQSTTGANSAAGEFSNMSVMISNATYLRKTGTTDHVAISGVQTNS